MKSDMDEARMKRGGGHKREREQNKSTLLCQFTKLNYKNGLIKFAFGAWGDSTLINWS